MSLKVRGDGLAFAGLAQAVAEGLPLDQLLLGILPLNSPGHMFHLVTGGFALYLGFAGRPTQRQAVSGRAQ
jgi:hypothetical protein